MPFYHNIKDFICTSTEKCCQKIRTCGMHNDKETVLIDSTNNTNTEKNVFFAKSNGDKKKIVGRRPTGWIAPDVEDLEIIEDDDIDGYEDSHVNPEGTKVNQNEKLYNVLTVTTSDDNHFINGIYNNHSENRGKNANSLGSIIKNLRKNRTNNIFETNRTNKGLVDYPPSKLTNSSDDLYRKEYMELKKTDKTTQGKKERQPLFALHPIKENEDNGLIKTLWKKEGASVYIVDNNNYNNGFPKHKKIKKRARSPSLSTTSSNESTDDDPIKHKKRKQNTMVDPSDKPINPSNYHSKKFDNQADQKSGQNFTTITRKQIERTDYMTIGPVEGTSEILPSSINNQNDYYINMKLCEGKQGKKRTRPRSIPIVSSDNDSEEVKTKRAKRTETNQKYYNNDNRLADNKQARKRTHSVSMTSDEDSENKEPISTKQVQKTANIYSDVTITESHSFDHDKYWTKSIKLQKKVQITDPKSEPSQKIEGSDDPNQGTWVKKGTYVYTATTQSKPSHKRYWVRSNLKYFVIIPTNVPKVEKLSTTQLNKPPIKGKLEKEESLIIKPILAQQDEYTSQFPQKEKSFSVRDSYEGKKFLSRKKSEEKRNGTKSSKEKKEHDNVSNSESEGAEEHHKSDGMETNIFDISEETSVQNQIQGKTSKAESFERSIDYEDIASNSEGEFPGKSYIEEKPKKRPNQKTAFTTKS